MRWSRKGLAGLSVVGLGATLLLTSGCTASSPTLKPLRSAVAEATSRACPVTPVQSTSQADVPAGIVKQLQAGTSAYGHGNLWVSAWWAYPAALKEARTKVPGGVGGVNEAYPYGMKYATWPVKDGQVTGEGGRPKVTVTSLDGRGYGSSTVGDFITPQENLNPNASWFPTVIGVTALGCYRVTTTQGGNTLSYVVKF